MKLADLDLTKLYSYADYFKWQFEERIELIKGKIFEMSAPNRIHQKLSSTIHGELYQYLKGKKCDVYSAPFDMRVARKSNADTDITTVLQPDICVICDTSILDERGCIGAPDIVVEILSPSNNKKELKYKYDIYEEAGVKEYWVIIPNERAFLCYSLREGKYYPSRLMVAGDIVISPLLPGFQLDLSMLFENLDS